MKKILKWFGLFIGGSALLACVIFLFIWIKFEGFKYTELGATISPKKLPFAIIFEDRNGEEFFRSFGNHNREWVNIEEVPETMKLATILSEDKRFYEHSGIDFQGISRAAMVNFQAGYVKQGGSTLTQQIAKKAFLSDEYSVVNTS